MKHFLMEFTVIRAETLINFNILQRMFRALFFPTLNKAEAHFDERRELEEDCAEALRGFESLGVHDTAQLGDDDEARCHGDCVARNTDIQGRKKCYQIPKSISHCVSEG